MTDLAVNEIMILSPAEQIIQVLEETKVVVVNPPSPAIRLQAAVLSGPPGPPGPEGLPGPEGPEGEPGSMTGITEDTEQTYRVAMFAEPTTVNGVTSTIHAIPENAPYPPTPTGFARLTKVNSVRLTWDAMAGATSYRIYRNGSSYATSTTTSYRDNGVTLNQTYTYTVQSVSAYGLRSEQTASVSAFIDPALNVAPTVEVRSWPSTIAAGNRAIIRVNALDVDAQTLIFDLDLDSGTLLSTDDPSTWILEP